MLEFTKPEELTNWLIDMFEITKAIPYNRWILNKEYWGIKKLGKRSFLRAARRIYFERGLGSIKTMQVGDVWVWHVREHHQSLYQMLILDVAIWNKYNDPDEIIEAWFTDEQIRRQAGIEEALKIEERRAKLRAKLLRRRFRVV